MRFEVLVLYYLRPPFSLQGRLADVAVSKLMDSVLGTVKPLFSRASDGSQSLLSPASERSTGLLLVLIGSASMPSCFTGLTSSTAVKNFGRKEKEFCCLMRFNSTVIVTVKIVKSGIIW